MFINKVRFRILCCDSLVIISPDLGSIPDHNTLMNVPVFYHEATMTC